MDGPRVVESEEQNNPLRQKIRDYLVPSTSRRGEDEIKLSRDLVNDGNRKIFIEEWLRAIQSINSLTELKNLTALAYTPHQHYLYGFDDHIRNIILRFKPELKNKIGFSLTANNPEYDGVRRATGEKLKSLGLTNSWMHGEKDYDKAYDTEYIFSVLHPNWREQYTYTATEQKGKFIFKRKVRVEKRGEKVRPYEDLIAELLQYNQPQSTSPVTKT